MQTFEIPEMYEVSTSDDGGMKSIHICFFLDKTAADAFAAAESKKKNWPHHVSTKQAKTFVVLENGENPFVIRAQADAMKQAKELADKLATIDAATVAAIMQTLKNR